jgi:hypothetical protein
MLSDGLVIFLIVPKKVEHIDLNSNVTLYLENPGTVQFTYKSYNF